MARGSLPNGDVSFVVTKSGRDIWKQIDNLIPERTKRRSLEFEKLEIILKRRRPHTTTILHHNSIQTIFLRRTAIMRGEVIGNRYLR